MQETIQAIKDIWQTMISLGYQPMPVLIAAISMLAARSYFEPDVLQVNSAEAVSRMGRIKLFIFTGVFVTNGLIQIGLAKPVFVFDWCLSVGFSLGNTMAAYVISSSATIRKFLKDGLFKGGASTPPTVQP